MVYLDALCVIFENRSDSSTFLYAIVKKIQTSSYLYNSVNKHEIAKKLEKQWERQ